MGTDAAEGAEGNGDILVVLLAAGAGSRFAGTGHKLLADPGTGTTVAGAAIGHAIAAGLGEVVVITGAVDLSDIVASCAADAGNPAPSVRLVHNDRWRDGQATSLQTAIRDAQRCNATAVVVGLADQPFVDPEAWRRVAAGTAPISVATYDGRRRNPVRLHRSVWAALPTEGDEGARSLLRMRPGLVEEIPCPGSPEDIDTLEDLESWQNRSSTNSP